MCFMTYLLVHYQNSEFRRYVREGYRDTRSLLIRAVRDRTRKMLDRLVIITVNTGVWTALLAIIDMTLVSDHRPSHGR